MRVVVTGASGFVGSAVVAALVEAEHEVVRLVHGDAGPDEQRFDLADLPGMAARFRGADAIVHAAGTSSTRAPESVLGWLEVAGTENVARAAKHAGVRRFVVFSSTDATLGTEARKSWNENRSVEWPIAVSGRIARAKEDTVIGAGSPRFEPVVLRAGYLYGPRDRTRAPRLVQEARQVGGLRLAGSGLAYVAATGVRNLAAAAALAIAAPNAAHGIYHVLDREPSGQQPFFARLSIALGLDEDPRPGGPLWLERIRARLRGDEEAEVLRRALSSSLDTRRAREDLGFVQPFSQEEEMQALGEWVASIGGADALAALARPTPDEASIAALERAAEPS